VQTLRKATLSVCRLPTMPDHIGAKLDMIYDTKEAYVWSSIADSAGNVYLGTGHEGRIFKVDSSGKGR